MIKISIRKTIFRFSLLATFLLLILPKESISQQLIKGKVSDAATGESLPGVTVIIQGSTNGTVTNIDGAFEIKARKTDSLVFSFIGYRKQQVLVGDQLYMEILMENEAELLDEVVVTALGIKREKKSLGYAVQEMKAKEIESISATNMSSQLAGKIAGLRVTTTNGGPGSSTGLVLRGLSSLKSNQALIVVDGIPVTNVTNNTSNEWGGKDFGNGIGDLNPEDIESISVLKGANASALYGSESLNGVVLITTKRGKKREGLGVSFSSTISKDFPYHLYEMQDTYGAGRNGNFEAVWEMDTATGLYTYNTSSGSAYGSWGPKMNGQEIIDWDGERRSFSPQPDNYKDIYQNGTTFTNNIALDGGSTKTTYRFSITNLSSEDIVPNTTLKRNTINYAMHSSPNKKADFDFTVSYINQKAENRLGLSNDALIPRNYIMMPRHITDKSLETSMIDEYGNENTWYTNWGWMRNPYWIIEREKNDDIKDRVLASSYFQYNFTEKLFAKIRGASDFFLQDFNSIGPFKGIYSYNGAASNSWQQNFLNTFDFLVGFNNNLTENIAFNINAGGMVKKEHGESQSMASDGGLTIPDFYNPLWSVNTPNVSYYKFERQLNALYGFGQLSYKSLCFLDLTYRNDWSSTLPIKNNSYYYPSASLAFVYSELFGKELQKTISFGKLRLSYSSVGGDASPYQIYKGYTISSDHFNGLSMAYLNTYIHEPGLKPEKKYSKEIGSELYFFMDRITLDVTVYDNYTDNQIIPVDISSASGASSKIINAGKITNKGTEIQLKAKPVKTKDFEWELKLNWAKNTNKVVKLADGIENKPLRNHWNIMVGATEGYSIGTIWGYGIKRDKNGNKIVNSETGLYERTDTLVILGNAQPDWIAGFSTTFKYKNISLFAHTDFSIGGDILSMTNLYGYGYSGNFEETLEGREEWYASEKAREEAGVAPEDWVATGGIKAEGVFEDGTPNSIYVNPEKYWDQFSSWGNEIHEPFVYDATYIKLREVRLSYSIPESITSYVKLKGADVAIFGRNLWLIHSKVPNIDPEANYTSDLSRGLELYSYPTRRSIGFNIRIKI